MILFKVILVFHVIICFALIVVVLLQSSKGGGLAGAFGGGGGGQTMFGGHETATFLSKATTYLAVLFMVLSLVLAFLSSRRGAAQTDSIVRRAASTSHDVIPRGQPVEEVIGTSFLDSIPADTLSNEQ
ncbi:MAG: preprotein translocase subunit SecG [Candidatus Latescibacterota bacterium]